MPSLSIKQSLYRLVITISILLTGACSTGIEFSFTGTDVEYSFTDKGAEYSFKLESRQTSDALVEGDSAGLDIPFKISRDEGHSAPISLSISGVSDADSAFVNTVFSRSTLTPANNRASVNLRLEIGVLPKQVQKRSFVITATDGDITDTLTVTVNVDPVDLDDVYLLIGQSNMVGYSGNGTREDDSGWPDEPNDRIKQINVTKNDRDDSFPLNFTSIDSNFKTPLIVEALDPLHVNANPYTKSKSQNYIGLGLTFAKTALAETSRDILLVPAAWPGTSFCDTSHMPAHWNALPTTTANLGNTLMFDRALSRINHALLNSGGILRGILWHQGESDSNSQCANQYGHNLNTLAEQLRSRIVADARGPEARGETSDVPFVVGTMSKGIDERGDHSEFSAEKSIVDAVHRNIQSTTPYSAVSIHDDLTPANGYPCGSGSCIHFGTTALREMGRRYYAALRGATDNLQ